MAGLEPSISLTTRPARSTEVDGVDYHFMSEEEFKRRIQGGELAEWATVFGACYGTPRGPLDRAVAEGRDILLDIDVQGARQLRREYPDDAVTILVMAPSLAELEQRLRRRATEPTEAIKRRLERAEKEISAYREYDYLLINETIEQALSRLGAMVEAERWRVARLRKEFAPWKS